MASTDEYNRNTTWSYVLAFLADDRSAGTAGCLMLTGTPQRLPRLFRRIWNRRGESSAGSSPSSPHGVRHYLNGLIWGYEKELERRVRVNEG